MQLIPDAETFAPGQSVQLDLNVRDENNSPVPAVLGISIVDDAVLNLAEDKSTRMPTYFHLLAELNSAEQLEDANFYLSDEPESVAALDSLLGTQGWRRFTPAPEMQFAQSGGGGFGGGADDNSSQALAPSRRLRSLAWTEDAVVPLSTARTIEFGKNPSRSTARSNRSLVSSVSRGQPFASAIVIASIGLLIMVCVASLRRVGGNRWLLISSALVAFGSLLAGTLSLQMKTPHSGIAFSAAASKSAIGETNAESAVAGAVELSEAASSLDSESFMHAGDEAATVSAAPAALSFLIQRVAVEDGGVLYRDEMQATPREWSVRDIDRAAVEHREDGSVSIAGCTTCTIGGAESGTARGQGRRETKVIDDGRTVGGDCGQERESGADA
ncbi:MAG: hypothetical protein HYV60_17955 [Planctomycetia bacterium]|nr:hypothetical protein [Planctomycetia bacterium]